MNNESAQAARDAGIQRAVDHAEAVIPGWSGRAFDFLRGFVETPGRKAFSAEDVRAYAHGLGLPQPTHARAWGGVFKRAAREGLIAKAGVGEMRDPESHCSVVNLWRPATLRPVDPVRAALANLLDIVDIAPPRNCYCHIVAPCGDCVEWSGWREAVAEAREALGE